MPNTRIPIMTSVVMTGRLMKTVVKFISTHTCLSSRGAERWRRDEGSALLERESADPCSARDDIHGLVCAHWRELHGAATTAQTAARPILQLVQIRVKHRRDVQRHDLRERQSA